MGQEYIQKVNPTCNLVKKKNPLYIEFYGLLMIYNNPQNMVPKVHPPPPPPLQMVNSVYYKKGLNDSGYLAALFSYIIIYNIIFITIVGFIITITIIGQRT